MKDPKQNLVPIRDSKRARELGSKGGKASAISKKQRKEMKEMLDILLNLPVNSKNKQLLETLGVSEEDMNNQTLVLTALMQKAIKGDIQAIKTIIDRIVED